MGELVRSFPDEGNNVTPSRRGIPGERAQSGDVAQEVKEVAGQAKELVAHEVKGRAGRSAEDIKEVAQALRHTREQLGGNVVAPYVDKAADQLEKLSRYLRDAEPSEVVRGVERFARREPLLFLGGAFALGILGARFLKSSSHHQPMGGGRGSMMRMSQEPRRDMGPSGRESGRDMGPSGRESGRDMSPSGRESGRDMGSTGQEPRRENGPRSQRTFVPSGNGGGV